MWQRLTERLGPVVKDLGDRVRDAPDKVRTGTRLSRQSGMLWSMTTPGIVEMVKALASGSQNPSLLYRIHAKNSPSKPALIWRGRTTTWAELDSRIDRFASGLLRRGVGRKQSLIVMMKNRQEMVELGTAAVRAKAATVAISWRSTAKELVYLANHSRAKGMVIEPELLHVYEQAKSELRPDFLVLVAGTEAPSGMTALDDLLDEEPDKIDSVAADEDDGATIIYTSGTTGKPKGAVRKYPKDTMFAAFRFINETPMRVDDVHLVTAPLYHSTAFGFLALSHILGNTAVIMDHFDPEQFLVLVDKYRVSTAAVVPTMLHRVLELPEQTRRKYDTRSLRALFSGGAPLPAPVALDFMDAFGDVVFNFYGATETGLVTLAKPQDLRHAPGTIGKSIPGNEIRLLDDDKRDVGEGQVGELFVKNKLLVAGYHDDDNATNESMVDGFFSVGDLARRDRDGNYFIEGRKRDMVISGGVNVYPAEVEGVLESHPDISEVAVVGVPDREWGERVRAFVVRREGSALDEGTLKLFAKERLAGPKVPRDFVFIEALPRNPTGKVLKRELRERPV
jgi:fatty-acyl-CoA synthase